ncbi:Small GTPase like protein, partial [Aduncisulcus paluster]
MVHKYKIVFIGCSGSGKTCLINQIVNKEFLETVPPTLGINYFHKSIKTTHGNFDLKILDTSGKDIYLYSLSQIHYRDADAIVIIFDISDVSSIKYIDNIYKIVEKEAGVNSLIYVVANKIDTVKRSYSTIDTYIHGKQLHYFKTSAKTGEGIDNLLRNIGVNVYRRRILHPLACLPEENGTLVMDNLQDSSKKFILPHVDDSLVCEMDSRRSITHSEDDFEDDLSQFFQGKGSLSFSTNIHITFDKPHFLKYFFVSSDSYSSGMRDFDITFKTTKKTVIKHYYMPNSIPLNHYFWQKFLICDIGDPVLNVEISIRSSWGKDQEKVQIHAIKFIKDAELERTWEKKITSGHFEKDSPTYNILVSGDNISGVTSLCNRICYDKFHERTCPTMGVDYFGAFYQTCQLQFIAISGMEVHSLLQHYLENKETHIFVILYNTTQESTFQTAKTIYQSIVDEFQSVISPQSTKINSYIVLVGTMADLFAERKVEKSVVETFAHDNEIQYFETSAKTGEGINRMLSSIVEMCVDYYQDQQKDGELQSIVDEGTNSSNKSIELPKIDDDSLICDIDIPKFESTEGYSQSKLVKFFQGKTSLSLTPDLGDVNLRIPFKKTHIISHFYISSQNVPSGIKRFKMHFPTVEQRIIIKEFSISSDIPSKHYFWEKFIIGISVPIKACYLEVLSPDGDDKQPKVHLHAIRFVIDKEMEKLKAEEKRFKIEKLRVEGEARRAAEVKEERRVEINELLSDFISSTKQTLNALRDELDATKKELAHTKAELEAEKTLRIQENKEFEQQSELKAQMDSLSRELSMDQQTSETKRLILSRDIRSLQRELSCVSARVSGQPPELCASVTKTHADTVSRRVSVLSPLSEYVSVSCDVDTMSSTLMTSVPCSLWHNALSDDGTLSHNAMMMLGLVSLFRALHDGCDDALSDGHLHDTDMNNGLCKCTMHESIRQVTCKMSAVSKTTTALHPALALESSSVCPRYIMEQ